LTEQLQRLNRDITTGQNLRGFGRVLSIIVGYARVSTGDQDLSLQEAILRTAICQVIRSEKKTGTQHEGRIEIDILLQFLCPGDTLVVTRIDQLACSLRDLQDLSVYRRAVMTDRAAEGCAGIGY
jgi:hypothetical protein